MSDFKPIVSSNLSAAAYLPNQQTLLVKFKNGGQHKYPNFPADLYAKFEKTFDGENGNSAGRFFHANIRHLPNEKVEN